MQVCTLIALDFDFAKPKKAANIKPREYFIVSHVDQPD